MTKRFSPSTLPWLPIAVTFLVLLTGAFAVQPIRDAATLADVPEAFLERPVGYVLLAPLSNALDMLTLMSVKQHIAMVLLLIIVFIAFRIGRHVSGRSTWRRHGVVAAWFFVTLLLAYAATAALPRPMARLGVGDANVIRVDFHSHTSSSHDGRSGFTAERNRAWHGAAGFDVAYIADHANVIAAEQGIAANPRQAAEGVTLLQSMEVTWTGEHVGLLNAQRVYKGLTTPNLRDVDEQALGLASFIAGREPVVVWHHPRGLNRLTIASGPGTPGIRAIEVINGSPDGMDDVRPQRSEIVTLAQQRNVALVSGSDNHGWGRAAPGWTIMLLFNWRSMMPAQVSTEIERAIRDGGVRATRVVERRVFDPGNNPVALSGTLFASPWRLLTTISNDERIVWIAWVWLGWAALWWNRRRRARMAS